MGLAECVLARFSISATLAIVIATVAVAAVAVAVSLGSTEAPPATGAAELVPGNALLYVHASTDLSRPAVRQAVALGRRFPGAGLVFAAVTDRLDAMVSGSGGRGVSFARDVRPWLGREAALAVLDTSGASAGSVVVLDVRDRAMATRFLTRVGARPAGVYRGVVLRAQPSGTVLAFVRHYLVLGQVASVQQALDVAAGRAPSLAATGRYERAAAGEPNDRAFDAYASADGIRRALKPRAGLLGDLGTLLDTPTLSAATISISPINHGLRILVHRTLDPKLVRLTGDRPVAFRPTLTGVLPMGSSLVLDVRNLAASTSKLLAIAAKVGVAGRIAPLLARLGSALAAQGVDLRQVLAMFDGETAIALAPGRDGGGPTPVIVARATRLTQARALLAQLELPLTQVFAPPSSGPGQVPEVNDVVVSGVAVHQLALAPGFGIDYAVAHGLIVISTSTGGITDVFDRVRTLNEASSVRSVVSDSPGRVSSLVFLDPSQLLRLGARLGLIGAPRQAALWPSVERIRAVSLASWRGAHDTTTELQLQIP